MVDAGLSGGCWVEWWVAGGGLSGGWWVAGGGLSGGWWVEWWM